LLEKCENALAPLRRFNGTQLKYFAAALMVLDHIHQMFAPMGAPLWLTMVGRLVAPIFLFMCAEGMAYTRDRKKYLLRLFLGFEFMNVATMIISRALPNPDVVLINNIFGTFLVTGLYIVFLDMLRDGAREKKPAKVCAAVGLMLLPLLAYAPLLFVASLPEGSAVQTWLLPVAMLVPNAFTAEGGPFFVLLGVLFYGFRKNRLAQAACLVGAGALLFAFGDRLQSLMALAAIPLLLYDGTRGRGGKFDKYFFYVFYPAHIYALYFIAWLAMR